MTQKNLSDPNHLEEATLHEYLDEVLDETNRAQVEAHLASCPACRDEVTALQGLFFELESLPKLALTRDLTPLVMDSVAPYPISWQTGRWLVLLQVAVAAVVLVFSWPLVARQAAGLQVGDWSVLAQAWLARTLETLAVTTTAWSFEANAFLAQVMRMIQEPLGFSMGGLNIWPWVAAIGLFWLLVNGWVLRPSSGRPNIKASNGNT